MSKSGELTVAELKKIIHALPYAELEETLCALYHQSKEASRFFNARFKGAAFAPKLLEDYQKELERYVPLDFRPLSMREAKKALTTLRKAAPDVATEVEILLRFVERCVLFTNTFGDIDEAYYTTAGKAFSALVDLVNAQENDQLFEAMHPRIGDEMDDLSASILWREE